MNDFNVVIDAGHGGSDPGAVSNGVNEKDLTLMISQYMYERFKEKGIPVTLIRSTDETISPSERVQKILAAYGNNPNVIVISNHINSNETGTAEGAEVIYALRNEDTLAKNILDELSKEGQIARSYYQRRLPNNPTQDYYFIHRETGVTQPVIVEYGFINNPTDLQKIKNNYRNYVDAVVRAVIETENGTVENPNEITYEVKPGNTLYSIAQMFNTSVDAIKKLNNLDSDYLVVGRILRIPTSMPNGPSLPANTTLYTVQRGDTLWSIARKYGTTVNEIMRLNDLVTDQIYPNQILKVPVNNMSNDNMNTNTITTIYTVQPGDSLWRIARMNNVSVEALKRANFLENDIIYIGQVLSIPMSEAGMSNANVTYTVQPGDTLWSISRRYNTTVNTLKLLNGLTSDLITPGQILKIY